MIKNTEDGAVPVIRLRDRKPIGTSFQVPTLIIDANLKLETVRHHWPRVKQVADVDVEAPNQRIYQVSDCAFSKARLANAKPLEADATDEQKGTTEASNPRAFRFCRDRNPCRGLKRYDVPLSVMVALCGFAGRHAVALVVMFALASHVLRRRAAPARRGRAQRRTGLRPESSDDSIGLRGPTIQKSHPQFGAVKSGAKG